MIQNEVSNNLDRDGNKSEFGNLSGKVSNMKSSLTNLASTSNKSIGAKGSGSLSNLSEKKKYGPTDSNVR